jgi:hypothetical protein
MLARSRVVEVTPRKPLCFIIGIEDGRTRGTYATLSATRGSANQADQFAVNLNKGELNPCVAWNHTDEV